VPGRYDIASVLNRGQRTTTQRHSYHFPVAGVDWHQQGYEVPLHWRGVYGRTPSPPHFELDCRNLQGIRIR
jgi:hypothetical protein